ncbi:MAG: aspartate--tRNA(Asn) ligase [Candidatus Aenigmatarchaeota archaeon]
MHCYTKDIPNINGKKVRVAGFVEAIRDIGKLKFLVLRDREGKIQVTSRDEEIGRVINSLTKESFIVVDGRVKLNKQAPNGREIIPKKIDVLSRAETPLPLDISGKIESTLDKRIDWRFIDMRNPKNMSVFILQSDIVKYISDFMHKNGFIRIFTSRLTNAATEGGANYFPILYFEKEGFLAQSPQLYKESILASGIDRVYDIGFVYRAEPHHTPRHLCEYVSFDLEMVCNSLLDILNMEQAMIKFVFRKINEKNKEILDMYGINLEVPNRIPRLTFNEANEILSKLSVRIDDYDLSQEGEKEICKYCEERYGTGLVFITEFPFKKKPFYIMRKENSDLCYSFDLLFRGLEITSGGQREHRYDKRVENLRLKGLDPRKYDHLRFWRYGMPPHGGFAIGLERLTMQILKLDNVREATLLPRDPERLTP